ncbi:alpha/beta fold hydrolase [Aeromicrobium wangtongii]|uniref:alpha/beta fold hydrolase n=1 Tax=Aeromicrobium wangtongii TaxID=2969247 RepID=UPI00201838D3|nr:alpha/beta fold hydrolase [Aeromicrobium wangtongii]MCL3816916.1 alpha/beta hydrolase [Aeromicrobium wangtongii]
MTPPPVRHFAGGDGVRLAYREVGDGPPVLLLHGFFTTGSLAWLSSGHAERLAARGHRVVMADLRGHGDSSRPHDPAAYPPDVLADDALALVEHLGLGDYDLAGYSLGARTVIRMLARGATPRRAAVGGAGYGQIIHSAGSGAMFRHVLENRGRHAWGSREWVLEGFLRKTGGDPEALLLVLDTLVDTPPERLAAIPVPTLVIEGSQDDPDSGRQLAAALQDAVFVEVPGDHIGASGTPELGDAIAGFLDRRPG